MRWAKLDYSPHSWIELQCSSHVLRRAVIFKVALIQCRIKVFLALDFIIADSFSENRERHGHFKVNLERPEIMAITSNYEIE